MFNIHLYITSHYYKVEANEGMETDPGGEDG